MSEERPSSSVGNRLSPWLLFFLFLFASSYFLHHHFGWNENSRLALMTALVRDGSYRIDPYQKTLGDKALFNGYYYSDKAIGLPHLATLPFLLLEGVGIRDHSWQVWGIIVATVALPSALAGMLLYVLMGEMCGGPDWGRALAVLGYGLGSLAFPYATLFYSHQPGGAFALFSFFGAWRAKVRPENAGRWLLLAGAMAGLAVVTEPPTLLLIFPLALWLFRQGFPRRKISAFIAGGLPFALYQAFYNWVCFGSPLANAYSYHVTYGTGMRKGLMGLTLPKVEALWGTTFSPYRGVFYLTPLLILALPGLMVWWQRGVRRAEWWLVVAMLALYGYFTVSYEFWDGVSSLGPRHQVPVLPFAFLTLPFAVLRWPWGSLGLWVLSAGAMLIGTAADPRCEQEVDSPLFYCSGFLASQGRISRNLGMEAGLSPLLSLFFLAGLVFLAAFWILQRTSFPFRQQRISFGETIMIAGAVLLWLTGLRGPETAAASKTESLRWYYNNHPEADLTEELFARYAGVLTLNPNNGTALHWTAKLYQRRGDYEKALEYWTRVKAAEPNNAEAGQQLFVLPALMGFTETLEPGKVYSEVDLLLKIGARFNPQKAPEILESLVQYGFLSHKGENYLRLNPPKPITSHNLI